MISIHFKCRSDGEIVYSCNVDTSQTQFSDLIREGFWTSEYFKSLPTRDLQIFYFIGSDERSVSAQSGDSLEKLGLKDGGIIEFDVVFGRDYLVSQMPGSFKVFDEIENTVGLNRLHPACMDNSTEHCNYLVINYRIFDILKQGGEINHLDLFACVRYSGISQRTTEDLVNRFDEHGFDEEQFFMIELVRWDQTKASMFGFSTPELASIGFEIAIAALHAAFASPQQPGIGSVTMNVLALEVLNQSPYYYEMVYNIVIEALMNPKSVFE